MKAGQTQAEIAHILGRHKSTVIILELALRSRFRGYRARQAQNLSDERSLCCCNATNIDEKILFQVRSLLSLQWSPVQIPNLLPFSHETIYQKIYADKAMVGHSWRSLRCQMQRYKRYADGRDRRGHIPDRRSLLFYLNRLSVESALVTGGGDNVIWAAHQHATIKPAERKSGYAVVTKVNRKTSDQV